MSQEDYYYNNNNNSNGKLLTNNNNDCKISFTTKKSKKNEINILLVGDWQVITIIFNKKKNK